MILSGYELKRKLLGEYLLEVQNIKKSLEEKKVSLNELKIGIISNIDDEPSKIYLKQLLKLFIKFNINYEIIEVSKEYSNGGDENYYKYIENFNKRKDIVGIFVQMPLVGVKYKENIINMISYDKDLEGITKKTLAELFYNNEFIVPPTPNSVIHLASYYNINFNSKNVVIINRSYIIGKPLIALLLNRDATVTVCHSKTRNLKDIIKSSDIIITAVGKPFFIKREDILKDKIIFDLSINNFEGKIVGDCDFEGIKDICDITPVPEGIGPITNLMLIKNYISLIKSRLK